jgi:hypothetical protein
MRQALKEVIERRQQQPPALSSVQQRASALKYSQKGFRTFFLFQKNCLKKKE